MLTWLASGQGRMPWFIPIRQNSAVDRSSPAVAVLLDLCGQQPFGHGGARGALEQGRDFPPGLSCPFLRWLGGDRQGILWVVHTQRMGIT